MPGGCEGGPVGRRTIPSSCSVKVSIDSFSLSLSVYTQHTNSLCMYVYVWVCYHNLIPFLDSMRPSLFGSSPEAFCVAPQVFYIDPLESDPRNMKYYVKIARWQQYEYVIFVFFAHKKYSCSFIKLRLNHWCHMDYFNDVLTAFLCFERGSSLPLLSIEGQRALEFHQKYLNLCFEDEQRFYGFGTTWG